MEITLRNLVDWVMKGIALILILTLLFGVGSFVFTKYFISPTYTTSVKFYASGSESNSQMINYYQTVAPQYIEFLNVTEFYETVSKDLQEDIGLTISAREIASGVQFSSIIEETSSFFVVVKTSDPTLSHNIALSIAEQAPLRIKDYENVGALEIIENPTLPSAPSGPNLAKNTIVGLFLGFLIGTSIVVLKEVLDTRIKTADEITDIFGLPIFGVVPDFSVSEKKGAQK